MKRSTIFILTFVLVSNSVAQQRARGLSPPGSIGKKATTVDEPGAVPEIACTISLFDPSGDTELTEGEKAQITVLVKNNLTDTAVEPKLEIQMMASWFTSPRPSVQWMDPIQPGQTGTYTASLTWDERLPSGTVSYQAKAVDASLGIASDPVEIHFSIVGKGVATSEPVIFVDVDKNIPTVQTRNVDAVAVIIGNGSYTNTDVPDVEYAVNDADMVKRYLMQMLGYLEENIIYLENAKKADFERIFGTREEFKGMLYNYVKPNNRSEIFIYYSGHGAPDMQNKKAYFMPSNCNPNYVRLDGYPLESFYNNLEKIPAKSITVVIDACFSGGSQQGMLIQDASPMYIDVQLPYYGNKLRIMTSAEGDQIASWYQAGNHSLFTYYLLRAVRGEADVDRNRKITLTEIEDYLKEHVPYMARRLYGREQTPVFKGDANAVIWRY